MAKSTKPKAATTKKVEDIKPELPKLDETVMHEVTKSADGLVPITDTETPIVGDTPPSVTLDEVEQVVEEPLIEKIDVEVSEPVKEEAFSPVKTIEVSEELSNEQKLLNFLESRGVGEIKLNDFLKSLYGVPKLNEPALWLKQSSSKEIRNMLDSIKKQGDYEIVNNNHLRLGAFYYPDTTTMKTEYHNINTIPLFARKVN